MFVAVEGRRPRAPPFLDPPGHARHRPESTLLYRLVKRHYPAFRKLRAESGRPLPGHVQEDFEAYLQCGRLEEGFLRVRCEECHAEKLVAFSCKRRGFCPPVARGALPRPWRCWSTRCCPRGRCASGCCRCPMRGASCWPRTLPHSGRRTDRPRTVGLRPGRGLPARYAKSPGTGRWLEFPVGPIRPVPGDHADRLGKQAEEPGRRRKEAAEAAQVAPQAEAAADVIRELMPN